MIHISFSQQRSRLFRFFDFIQYQKNEQTKKTTDRENNFLNIKQNIIRVDGLKKR
jgi:hypothetical protein